MSIIYGLKFLFIEYESNYANCQFSIVDTSRLDNDPSGKGNREDNHVPLEMIEPPIPWTDDSFQA